MAVEIQTVGIIGGGVMGSGIAQVLASAGLKVVLYDLTQEALDKALDSIKNSRYGLTRGVELGKLGPQSCSGGSGEHYLDDKY